MLFYLKILRFVELLASYPACHWQALLNKILIDVSVQKNFFKAFLNTTAKDIEYWIPMCSDDDAVNEEELILCCALCCANCSLLCDGTCVSCSGKVGLCCLQAEVCCKPGAPCLPCCCCGPKCECDGCSVMNSQLQCCCAVCSVAFPCNEEVPIAISALGLTVYPTCGCCVKQAVR